MGIYRRTAMIVSTKGRYALRVLIDIAEHNTDSYITLKEIAARQEISEKYLESIAKELVNSGILEGLRGKGGGYRLRRSPDTITAGEVLKLTEGDISTVPCLKRNEACSRTSECRTVAFWKGLDKVIDSYVESYTIADLMRREQDGNEYII